MPLSVSGRSSTILRSTLTATTCSRSTGRRRKTSAPSRPPVVRGARHVVHWSAARHAAAQRRPLTKQRTPCAEACMTCSGAEQVLTAPLHAMLRASVGVQWTCAGHAAPLRRLPWTSAGRAADWRGPAVDQCRSCSGRARPCAGPREVVQRTSARHAEDHRSRALDQCRHAEDDRSRALDQRRHAADPPSHALDQCSSCSGPAGLRLAKLGFCCASLLEANAFVIVGAA